MEEKTIKGIRYSLDENTLTAKVIQKKGYSGDIVIPEVVVSKKVSYRVVGIDVETFNLSDITSITIPNSVISIGNSAFRYCTELTSITIPDSVTTIEQAAFESCRSLISITIPDGVTSIGEGAFSGCTSLTSITIPDGVTSIGSTAFRCCSKLTSITIPASVTSIGLGVFSHCDSLASIIVDKNNKVYDSRDNCNAIIETATNTLIRGCQNTIIPEGVITIGDSAFSGCESLTSITIPNGVTSIENSAFSGCESLTSIIIPDSVTSIESMAFEGCDSLSQMPVQEVEIDNLRFRLLMHNQRAMLIGFSSDNIKLINIPAKIDFNGVEYCVITIVKFAFSNCKSLTNISIPDSVTTIRDRVFRGCPSLSSITIDKNNKVYDSRDNCNAIIKTETDTLIVGCQNTIIPDGVTNIGVCAFEDCEFLTSINIPDSVTTISEYAFWRCDSLTSINIPDSVTSIGHYAFESCDSLTSITIPNGVTSIENGTFSSCKSLASINIPNSVTSIGGSVFSFCASLASITIPNNVTTIGRYAFWRCISLADIRYNGTIEQWQKIKLENTWNKDIPSTIVHCTDGDVEI